VGASRERTAVVLDPYPLWLDAVESVLSSHGVTVVGRSSDADQAVALVVEHKPGILVADPASGGIECMQEATQRVPGLKAIALASTDDPALIRASFAAGAVAYVVKTAHSDVIGLAIRQAFSPTLFLPDPLPAQAAEADLAREGDHEVAVLTRREREILRLVAEGHSNSQLARMLWVTEQTVKFHLSNIYRKLGVANRTEASRWAQVHGLLSTSAKESLAADA
jgi:DNA-binding NarL/FixJ family response regulator